MKRTYVRSSVIKSHGYDADTSTLELEWRNGHVYQYFMVPAALYAELVAAPSMGAFVNERVKTAFPCKQIK